MLSLALSSGRMPFINEAHRVPEGRRVNVYNCIDHNSIDHNHTDHNCIGHKYIGHHYFGWPLITRARIVPEGRRVNENFIAAGLSNSAHTVFGIAVGTCVDLRVCLCVGMV